MDLIMQPPIAAPASSNQSPPLTGEAVYLRGPMRCRGTLPLARFGQDLFMWERRAGSPAGATRPESYFYGNGQSNWVTPPTKVGLNDVAPAGTGRGDAHSVDSLTEDDDQAPKREAVGVGTWIVVAHSGRAQCSSGSSGPTKGYDTRLRRIDALTASPNLRTDLIAACAGATGCRVKSAAVRRRR